MPSTRALLPATLLTILGCAPADDPGPYPIPDNLPIEGWPAHFNRYLAKHDGKFKGLTLEDVQRDKVNEDSDRHAVVVDPTNRVLYEFFQMKRTDAGWQAACAAVFDLKSNKLRPDAGTSPHAAA